MRGNRGVGVSDARNGASEGGYIGIVYLRARVDTLGSFSAFSADFEDKLVVALTIRFCHSHSVL